MIIAKIAAEQKTVHTMAQVFASEQYRVLAYREAKSSIAVSQLSLTDFPQYTEIHGGEIICPSPPPYMYIRILTFINIFVEFM